MTISVIPIVWAATGTKEDPETSQTGKTTLGWLPGERPAMEWENFTKNRSENKINEVIVKINAGVSLTELTSGNMNIIRVAGLWEYTSTIQAEATASNIFYKKKKISTVEYDFGNFTYTGLGVQNNNADDKNINASYHARGIMFAGDGRHPVDGVPPYFNKSVLDTSALSFGWTQDTDSNGNRLPSWSSDVRVDLKIPTGLTIMGITARFAMAGGSSYLNSPVTTFNPSVAGGNQTAYIRVNTESSVATEPGESTMKLYIEFDGTNL